MNIVYNYYNCNNIVTLNLKIIITILTIIIFKAIILCDSIIRFERRPT